MVFAIGELTDQLVDTVAKVPSDKVYIYMPTLIA